MSECIFCDIAIGKAPASFVYQDADTMAFMDIYTLNRGQVVVTTRKHFPTLSDMDEATGKKFFTTATRVCQSIRNSGFPCDGINMFLSDGEAAGQDVFHVHFMVIPRIKGDGMTIAVKWTRPSRAELDKMAEILRRVFPSK
jgi:histidine triad (HIT) family protein